MQQVIGALGHLWSSDSISLSSQTQVGRHYSYSILYNFVTSLFLLHYFEFQSDDDYEPVQSDSSPQMPRLSPLNGSQNMHSIDLSNSPRHHLYDNMNLIPDTRSNAVPQSFLHSSTRTINDHLAPNCSLGYPKASAQSTPFLHSSAASAAVAASAVTSRLSQCSKRSSGCDSVYSPCSSGSSLSDSSHHSILQAQQNVDGVYEPIEEKQKVCGFACDLKHILRLFYNNLHLLMFFYYYYCQIQNHSQRSFLHSKPIAGMQMLHYYCLFNLVASRRVFRKENCENHH